MRPSLELPKATVLRWVRQRSGALAAHQAAAVLPDRVDTRNPLHRRRLRELDTDLKTIDRPARACFDVARGVLIGPSRRPRVRPSPPPSPPQPNETATPPDSTRTSPPR